MNNSSTQIKFGAIIAYLNIGINITTGLLYTPWLIRSIGKDDYGLYTLVMSVISLFVFDFGLSNAIGRFVAKYLAERKPDQINNCLGLIYKLYIFLDIILLLFLVIVYWLIPEIYQKLTPPEIEKFKIIYAIAAIFSIISFPFIPVDGILSAHEKFILLNTCNLLHKLVLVGAMSICLLLGYGLYALVLTTALSGVLTIALKLFCIRQYTEVCINFAYHEKNELMSIVVFSGWTTVIAISQRCIFNIAPSILGILSGSSSIAVLGIAIMLEGYIFTFANALNSLFLPRVANIITNCQQELLPLMIRIGRIQICIIGLLVFGFIFCGHDFIVLWLGKDFSQVYLCAVLLIVPTFFHLPQGIATTSVLVVNQVRLQGIVFLVMAAINLILVYPFTKFGGVTGMSLSICIAYFIRTIGMDLIFWKKLKIDIFKFFKNSFGKLCIPLLLPVVALSLYYYGSSSATWLQFFAKVTTFTIVYCSVVFFAGLNHQERISITVPILKFLKIAPR